MKVTWNSCRLSTYLSCRDLRPCRKERSYMYPTPTYYMGSITLVKAGEEALQLVFLPCFRGLSCGITPCHQRACARGFRCQDPVLRSDDSGRNGRFRRGGGVKVMKEHLDNLAEIRPVIWVLLPTGSQNNGQLFWKIVRTGPYILKERSEIHNLHEPHNRSDKGHPYTRMELTLKAAA